MKIYQVYYKEPWEPEYTIFYTPYKAVAEQFINEANKAVDNYGCYNFMEYELHPSAKSCYIGFVFGFDINTKEITSSFTDESILLPPDIDDPEQWNEEDLEYWDNKAAITVYATTYEEALEKAKQRIKEWRNTNE